jgi:fructosamine-3-kinase
MDNQFEQIFESVLFESTGLELDILDFSLSDAGIVNTCARVSTAQGHFFVKMNERPEPEFFRSEAADLEFLGQHVPVPAVIGYGKTAGWNFLLTEFVEEGVPTQNTWSDAGRILASLHQQRSDQHGFTHSNFLASLSMDNKPKLDGIDFLIQNRILPAIGLCLMEEKISIDLYKRIESFCARLGRIIPQEEPSLLHGDLWTGNLMLGQNGKAIFIDPAAYYGFRESELAFTYLFGGFDRRFYESYLEVFPLEPGFGERVSVYHIHPLLVHVQLFGGGYIAGIEKILKRFA